MKNTFLLLLVFFTTAFAHGQVLEPVKWTVESKKINDKEYEIIYTAKIEKGWHLYSQNLKPGGPNPTNFSMEKSAKYAQVGKVTEETGYVEYDKVFEMDVRYFKDKALFKQKVKKVTTEKVKIIGEIEFMSCNGESCVPGYFDIEIEI